MQSFTGGGGTTLLGRRRICFQLKFRTDDLQTYLKDHEAVWPDMQEALVSTGWHNYSLFFRPDGLAFGYFETDATCFAEACTRMDMKPVNARWQAAMAKYTPDECSPIDAAQELKHYFYLGADRTFDSIPACAASNAQPSAFTGGGGTTLNGHRRIGFQMKFATDDLDGYLRDHEAVWPEMQEALLAAGWHNYSLFYRTDGLAFGYFETDAADFAEACSRMEAMPVNARWQAAMAKYTPSQTSPIDAAQQLTHYFYLGTNRILKPIHQIMKRPSAKLSVATKKSKTAVKKRPANR